MTSEDKDGVGCLVLMVIAVFMLMALKVVNSGHDIDKLRDRVDALEKAIKVEAPK